MKSAPDIESLPREVLLHMFSFLSPAYLCETVSQVCTHWEDLCGDPLLYRELKFTQGEVSEQTVVKILKLAPLLESLTLVDWNCTETILEVVSQHNQKIRDLVLAKTIYCDVIISEVMMKILHNCTEIESLILHKYVVRGKDFYNNICIQLPRLKTLHATDNGTFSSELLVHLANSDLELEDFKMYDSYAPSNYDNATALCNRFCKTLRSLELGCGAWPREAVTALQKCDRLKTLSIKQLRHDDGDNIIAIGSIPTLRHLEFGCFSVPETSLVRLFSSEGLKNLLSLELYNSHTTDRVAAAIGDHLKNLETLTLHGRKHWPILWKLSTWGVRSIIKGCSKIRRLNLFMFEANTFEVILQLIPQYLPGLRSLFVFPHEEGSFAQIKTQMPELHIEYEHLSLS